MSSVAKTVTLTELVPEGMPGPEHFQITESSAPTADDLGDGDYLLKVMVMSPDPYLRFGIKAGDVPRPMTGFVAGKVLASKSDKYVEGDYVGAMLPFSDLQIVKKDQEVTQWKLTGMVDDSTISLGVGTLGMPGSTAYGGVKDVLRPKEDTADGEPETFWVSGAAGAVGSIAGQIAKNVYGCKVIGSCGGPAKIDLCKKKFKMDECIDYKTCPDLSALKSALKAVAPEGIDMFYDNVGGMHFEAAMDALRPHGRIAICGGISGYNEAKKPTPFYPMDLIYGFKRVEGFMALPWLTGKKGNFLQDMHGWVKEGKVVAEETFFEGIDSWPKGFQSLFTGGNMGKVVIRCN